ncbi:MAG: YfhO family protein [Bacilli bacterium]
MRNKRFKEYFLLSLILALILFICFLPYSINFLSHNTYSANNTFMIKNDWILQHTSFYQEFFRTLDNGYIGWSWNFLFGSDILASKSSLYFIGDIYALLAYGIYKIIHYVPSTLFIITVFKIYISGITFNLFLEKHKISFSIRILLSIAFMLSGWTLIFMEHPLFISFYTFLPLVLAGLENILQKKKNTLFIISSTLMLMTSYYFSWSFFIYILLY